MPRDGRHSRLLATAVLAAGATAVVGIATTRPCVQRMDREIERVTGRHRRRLRPAASVGTLPGEPWAHWMIGVCVATTILSRRRRSAAVVLVPLAGASLGAILAHHAVKAVYRRPRPRIALRRGKTEPAFPSGHTADATAVLATSAYLLVREEVLPARVAAPAAAALALGTGVSRVILGWHWASDVVGGWLTGAAVASACAYGYERLRDPRSHAG